MTKKFLKGNRRYTLQDEGHEVTTSRAFLGDLFEKFANSTFSHYAIPRSGLKPPGGEGELLPMDVKDHRTMRFRTLKTGVRREETKQRELVDVQYLASVDWTSVLEAHWNSLLTRDWKFTEHLRPETLLWFQDQLPQYFGADRPVRREERKKKRKRNALSRRT